jgi:hypothetical protein
MAKQYRVLRKVASVPFVAGSFATLDLPRDYDYETIFMRINGSVTVSTNYTAVRAEAPTQLVQRAEVIADGKNNIFSAPFWFASNGNYSRNLLQNGARVLTGPSAATTATYAVEAIGAIDLMTGDSVRPKDSNFRSSGLSLFQLRLTFGQTGDLFTGAGASAASGTIYVDVFVQQLVEIADQAGAVTTPIALKKVSFQEVALTSSNANQEVRLPAGNFIRSAVIRTDGATTAGEPSTAVLNNVQLTAGVDVRMNLSGVNLRAKNNADYGFIPAGYYVADVCSKGEAAINLTDLWDVTGAAEPKVIVDVNGSANTKMQVVVTEYIMGA